MHVAVGQRIKHPSCGRRCQILDGKPSCNYTFNAVSRASGLAQITRVPEGGTVEFVSCGVYMDNAIVTSTSCFQVGKFSTNQGEFLLLLRHFVFPADSVQEQTIPLHLLRDVCLQDDSTTVVPITVPFAEQSVSKISFISTYKDSSPDGPPGEPEPDPQTHSGTPIICSS